MKQDCHPGGQTYIRCFPLNTCQGLIHSIVPTSALGCLRTLQFWDRDMALDFRSSYIRYFSESSSFAGCSLSPPSFRPDTPKRIHTLNRLSIVGGTCRSSTGTVCESESKHWLCCIDTEMCVSNITPDMCEQAKRLPQERLHRML